MRILKDKLLEMPRFIAISLTSIDLMIDKKSMQLWGHIFSLPLWIDLNQTAEKN